MHNIIALFRKRANHRWLMEPTNGSSSSSALNLNLCYESKCWISLQALLNTYLLLLSNSWYVSFYQHRTNLMILGYVSYYSIDIFLMPTFPQSISLTHLPTLLNRCTSMFHLEFALIWFFSKYSRLLHGFQCWTFWVYHKRWERTVRNLACNNILICISFVHLICYTLYCWLIVGWLPSQFP